MTSMHTNSPEEMADLYSIFLATEFLERAYIRGSITANEYTPECLNLIAQFKTARSLVDIPDIPAFLQQYQLKCPAAVKRLLGTGVPATIEHQQNQTTHSSRYIAESVQLFITLMDALKLNMIAVDQIHPLLSDLIQSLHKTNMAASYKGTEKIKEWLILLNQKKASDEMSGDQTRQLLFDLENAHTEFHRSLGQ